MQKMIDTEKIFYDLNKVEEVAKKVYSDLGGCRKRIEKINMFLKDLIDLKLESYMKNDSDLEHLVAQLCAIATGDIEQQMIFGPEVDKIKKKLLEAKYKEKV